MSRAAGKLAVMALACALSILLAEGLVRALWSPNHPSGPRIHHFDPRFGLIHEPGEHRIPFRRCLESRPCEDVEIRFTVSEAGYRSLREGRGPASPIVLMLGDSMVEAAQVDDRQTAAFLLEESLRQHFPGVEVRNLGISSAGLVHYHARWARWGRTMDADLVIVAVFGLNDFRNCSTELESFRAMRPYYVEQQGTIIATFRQPEAPSFSPLRLWAHRATRGLELVRLLRDVKAARQEEGDGGQPGFLDATIFVPDPPPPWPEAVARGVEYLRELIRETFAEGVPILVVYLPWRVEAIDSEWADFASRDDRLDRWRPRRLVEDVAGSESARFLSFTDVVAGLPAETKRDVWHVETDSHLSAVGNRLLAEALKAPVTEILEAPD